MVDWLLINDLMVRVARLLNVSYVVLEGVSQTEVCDLVDDHGCCKLHKIYVSS